MSPAARNGWRDALAALALYFSLLALCDPAPAATLDGIALETTMPESKQQPSLLSEGPFSYHRHAVGDGFTTIHDSAGRVIGASTSGNSMMSGAPRLDADAIAANGRLFAASYSFYSAVTAYIDAVARAKDDGVEFGEDLLDQFDEAEAIAIGGYNILFGAKGALP